ncbi:MAG: hypothetical protein JO188_04340 [Hyphomicrobiales bacterium]|nr:hypothetical protein [Hyphomicrobiales bacterium]
MRKELASAIMEATQKFSPHFAELDGLIRTIEDEAERKSFLDGLGRVMLKMIDKIQMPIIRQHRELDPDKNPDGTWRE